MSYVLPCWIPLRAQPGGRSNDSPTGTNVTSLTKMHPITGSSSGAIGLSPPISLRSSARLAAPLASPNWAQAWETGMVTYPRYRPPPTTRLIGALALKTKYSPSFSARKLPPPGFQKLTTGISDRVGSDRNRYHSGLVTATNARIPVIVHREPAGSWEIDDRRVCRVIHCAD